MSSPSDLCDGRTGSRPGEPINTFHALDWLVVGGYFAVLLGVALWVLRQRQETSTDYFLAGRHVGWFVIGPSIFASNIGSEHIV